MGREFCKVSGKKVPLYFSANFAKCWPIFKILSPTNLPMNLQLSDNKISRHLSNAWLHYLVKCLCSKMVMLQSSVERTAMQNSVIRNSYWKIFIQWCKHNFVNWWKDIYSSQIEKPKESPIVRNCTNQEERRHDKTLAHTINVQTVTDGISRRVTSGWENTKLDTCRSRSLDYWGLLSWCDAVLTVTVCHALDLKRVHLSAGQCPAHVELEAVNFLTNIFARSIPTILSGQTRQ